jgi:hypothetical protein
MPLLSLLSPANPGGFTVVCRWPLALIAEMIPIPSLFTLIRPLV